ncbi:MAG: TonB-dependent receptor, partial [Chitinophagaceae bacterium]|nr:TonB-dependent receptor [Chitinophagaceae bacterium]
MKRSFLYLFILMLLGTASTAFAQNGEIYGTVTDETNNPFPGVVIKVTQGGLMKGGSITEDDGTYSIKPLQPGSYSVQFSSLGYGTKEIASITVSNGGSVKINNKMTVDAKGLNEVVKVAYKQPVVNKVTAIGSEKIESAPTRNILDMASLGPNVQQTRSGGELRIGGARGDGTVYMLDGQVIQGSITPAQGTVEQLQVFTSGIPANLGDATGGVVSITSKGLTNKFKGAVQAQRSIDGYNNNLLNASFTGPLISRMRDGVKEPILGFLAGIDYQYDKDDNPTFIKNPVLKKDVLNALQENPLTLVNTQNGTVMLPSSNNVSKDDFVMQKQQLNNATSTVRFNGKLDYAVNNNINVTAGGSFNYNNSQVYSRTNSYFAPDAIPNQVGATYRGYLRLRQSFNNKNSTGTGDSAKRAVISNAFYTLQLDYQYTTSKQEDPNFKRNLFDYGYVGKFTQSRVPLYQSGTDTASGRQAIVLQTLDAVTGIAFQASDKNPVLANYTKNVYQNANSLGFLSDLTQIQRYNGMMNGDFPNTALTQQNVGINNIGTGLTGYNYGTFSQFGLHADA